jgi:hypothetical protein
MTPLLNKTLKIIIKGEWSLLSQHNNHQWVLRAIRDQGSQILKTWLHHSHWTLTMGCVQGKIQPGRNVLSVNLGCSLRIMTSCIPVGGYYIVKDPNNHNCVWLVNFTTSADVKSMFQCFTLLSLDGIVQSEWLCNQSDCTVPHYHFCHWIHNYVSNGKNETIKYDWFPALQKGYCRSDQYVLMINLRTEIQWEKQRANI